MNYHHLTIEERSCIRKYYVDGLSYREIARLIGRNVSTVSREIRRNCTHMYDIPTYYPHTAQKKYLLRRSYCHRGMFRSQEVIEYIEEKLKATWSPEQIACTPCELKMPSWRTIYRWIYEKYLVNGNLKVLRRKGKSHGSRETRGKYSNGKSIRKRDKSVYSRKEAGHWEADTVVSGQGKSRACFATLAERKTRFYIAVKMPDRRAETMENAIVAALSAFPPQLVKTITCDRGSEFANWHKIEERLHCEVYFADPYCAWQKGTNEKPIVTIHDKRVFSGYEDFVLTYDELREIVKDPTAYESWHAALSSVNAVYLIVDRENGRQYVGSAYGKGGLLERWAHYVDSLHGGNKLMKELLCSYPERYTHFQFSILQLLPKTVKPEDVIHTETLWKKKLLSYEPIGMNAN